MEPRYKTFAFDLVNHGLLARYVADRPRDPAAYFQLENLVSRAENSLASRLGLNPITGIPLVSPPSPYTILPNGWTPLRGGTQFGAKQLSATYTYTYVGTLVTVNGAVPSGSQVGDSFYFAFAGAAFTISNIPNPNQFQFVWATPSGPSPNSSTFSFGMALIAIGYSGPIGGLTIQSGDQATVSSVANTAFNGTFPVRFVEVFTNIFLSPHQNQAVFFVYMGFNSVVSSSGGGQIVNANSSGNVPLSDLDIHTLSRLKSIGGNTFRYAGAGPNLYRRAGDTPGSYARINLSALSGNRFSSEAYSPLGVANPYLYIADALQMLKDTGMLSPPFLWGIDPPQIPAQTGIQAPNFLLIDDFDAAANTYDTSAYFNSPVSLTRVNTATAAAITLGSIQTVPVASTAGMTAGIGVVVDTAGNAEEVYVISVGSGTFTAFFTKNHSSGVAVSDSYIQIGSSTSKGPAVRVGITAHGTGYSQGTVYSTSATSGSGSGITLQATSVDSIHGGLLYSALVVAGGNIYQVGDTGTIGSGGATYIVTGITPSAPPQVSGIATISKSLSIDLSVINGTPMAPTDAFVFWLYVGDVAALAGATLNLEFYVGGYGSAATGNFNAPLNIAGLSDGWNQITIQRSNFTASGSATGSTAWASVAGWAVWMDLPTAGPAPVLGFDYLIITTGAGPNVTGGVPYDYLYTYVNGDFTESNPSVPQISASFLSPVNQPVLITFASSSDPQVKFVNIYRRGGTLGDNWRFVGQAPNSAGSFLDTASDLIAALGKIVSLTNDPPVTAPLPQPVNTTFLGTVTAGSTQTVQIGSLQNVVPGQVLVVDSGTGQETVIVQSVGTLTITAYFQLAHAIGASIVAYTKPRQGCPLLEFAFGQAWLAGDPNNPHFLYYSSPNQVEYFPPQNYVQVSTPDDPIMAVLAHRGQLYCFTLKTVYQIIVYPGSVPQPYPTGCRHGLVASFAWCRTEQGIEYLSHDGWYVFGGAASGYLSEAVQWIFTNEFQGPVPNLDYANAAHLATAKMAFWNNYSFLIYTDVNGVQRRMRRSFVYKRFEPDDIQATAIFTEEDTNTLVVGEANGMIYQDQVNDFDGLGFASGVLTETPIAVAMQSMSLDLGAPKQDKQWNEVTVDVFTNGQNLNVSLVFGVPGDAAQTTVSLGTINTSVRKLVTLPVQPSPGTEGQGYRSREVSLLISGSVTKVAWLYQASIRALVFAEPRNNWDTFWLDFGIPGWKVCKQIFAEYETSGSDPVTVSVYLDGAPDNTTLPAAVFTFILPPTNGARSTLRVRFPAFKGRLWRFIGTSPTDFGVYETSVLEVKPAHSTGGYKPAKLLEPA